MVNIVITGHGNFASGIKSMLNMVIGELEMVHFIDFNENISSDDLFKSFSNLIVNSNGNVIFLCDLAGGTPFNKACISMNEQGYLHGVIGGINIPLIIDLLDARTTTNDLLTLCKQSKISAIDSIFIFNDLSETKKENNNVINSMEDGI